MILSLVLLLSGSSLLLAQCQAPELAKLADASPGSQYFFGHSVAMDGDVAAVGAYRDWTADRQAGAVFVFRWDGASWVEEAMLLPSDIEADDEFGVSVAVSGDTLVVGSHFDDDGGRDSGSAYVFVFDGLDWNQEAKLTASDTIGWDNFGYSVAVHGDVVVVGANLDDDDGANSGAAYVFEKPGAGWTDMTETAKLTASDAAENDEFGKSVAVHGNTIVAGAHYVSTGTVDLCGAAYVFVDEGSGWTQAAKLTASDPANSDRLGISVAAAVDLVVAGAWGDDDGGNQSGSVYLYEKPAGGWTDMTQTAKLTASVAAAGDHLGWSVAASGGYVVAGAPAHLWDGSGFGAAYAFEKPSGGWLNGTETARYTASDGAQDDEYGTSVAVSAGRALIGAPFHRTGDYYGAGAAYVQGGLADCQPNGVTDVCDIAGGSSSDGDGNGVPDECEGAGTGSGSVQESLRLAKAGGGEITLSWNASCIGTDDDYALYEGLLGDFRSHVSRFCTTSGELQKTFQPAVEDSYYLVVAGSAVQEGSYGPDGSGEERSAAAEPCLPRVVTDCPE